MNRIEPIGPAKDEVQAIPIVPRRAPDRDRAKERPRKRPTDTQSPQESGEQAPNRLADGDGEHVDVRA